MGGLSYLNKGLSGTEPDLSGYVVGPASSTNNDIALFDGITGKLIKDSGVQISTDGTFAANSDALVPTQKATKTYVDGLVVGLLDDRGNYDASGNTFPASGGSGAAGAILKGDIWRISVAGTLGGVGVSVGDWVLALVDTPGQTAANWAIAEGTDSNGNISANNFLSRYATTATAAGTTTLTVSSAFQQYFTGSTTQTVTLPVTSTLALGQGFEIVNLSSGAVTVQSSGGNTLQAMAANTRLVASCISTSGTGTASWNWVYLPVQAGITGTGDLVRATSPTLVTPALGTPASGNLANCTLPVGTLVNFSSNSLTTGDSTTDLIPTDGSTPQSGEGKQIITVSHTPKNANNTLEIEYSCYGTGSVLGTITSALFKDSDTDALRSKGVSATGADNIVPLDVKHTMTAGTTSAITFKVRSGGNNAGTAYFNRYSSAQLYGGNEAILITVKEYQG